MPHIVFDKKLDLVLFSNRFHGVILKEPFLIKLLDVFLDREKRTALIPTIVIDQIHQHFLIEVSTRKDKTTIRLLPVTDPKKTDGVKMSLAMVGKIIQENNPQYNITKTNLQDFLFQKTESIV